jgi:hypothetical protein
VSSNTDHLRIQVAACMMWMLLVLPFTVLGQGSGSFKRQGDQAYASGQYRTALQYYRQGGLESSKDEAMRIKIGVCLYEINDIDGAVKIFQALINEGKTNPSVFLADAKCYQAKNQFDNAIGLYKKYIQRSKPDDAMVPWVKDEIVRCANGARLRYAEEQAYVENAGTTINTQFEEFGVRTSPTTLDKIYFNSDREDIERAKWPNGNVDIYAASLINGRWNTPTALPYHINSVGYDELIGFTGDGQILYYLTAIGKTFAIRTDTFSTEEGKPRGGKMTGPFTTGQGGADLIFFNDTICLFACNKLGGYGGYDIFISMFQNGAWSKGTNLGPAINSFYDDRFPFLTRDGLTLFYSSNNLESIGGFDIFSASFDPNTLKWSYPQNAGFPINSALDDTYLVLSSDGMTAFLSSERKEGYGEKDIYRVFFKQPLIAHQHISVIPTFHQLLLLMGNSTGSTAASSGNQVEVKEYYISHLFLDANAEVLTPQNNKKLDLLANLMLIYPKITTELSCFELSSGQNMFNLYFSIKKSEKAADYLVSKGIQRNRLLLKGYGSSFPLVAQPAGSSASPIQQKLNQRLEISLHDYENEPVIIHVEDFQVPENSKDPRGIKFSSLRSQLYYSVQLVSISQILQNQDLESVGEMFIEVDNRQGNYLYMSGMLPTFKEAEKSLKIMMDMGFPDAKIIPYINGIRVPASSISDLAKQYPDLLFYLNGVKNK